MCPKSQSRQEHDSLRNLHCACRENLFGEIESEIDQLKKFSSEEEEEMS